MYCAISIALSVRTSRPPRSRTAPSTTKFLIEKDETILTEYSHKYTLEGFAAMAGKAGFDVARVWTDADELFSVQYCLRR
jgi:uncharacterized SAM-dependent methyltransferase